MKKVILLLAAMASMMTACTNNETLETTAPQAITFGNAFVDKATRSIDNSYNEKQMFDVFQVYGTISNSTGTANIFPGTEVSYADGKWSYDSGTQYWIPGNTYNFKAIVDGNIENVSEVKTDKNGMPTIITVLDASQQKDVLYAKVLDKKYNKGDQVAPVSFIFKHLMAKAKFTVKNAIKINSGYTYKVKKITMSAPKTATYTIADKAWGKSEGAYPLEFGNITNTPIHDALQEDATMIEHGTSIESAFERLLIPSQTDTKSAVFAKFTYELYKDDVLIDTQIKEVKAEVELVAGYAYNFVIELAEPGEPITFNVQEVKNWIEQNDINTKN